MSPTPKRIAILGSTGSIGGSALEVVRALGPAFQVVGLSAHSRLPDLVAQAREFRPEWIVATDASRGRQFAWPELPGTRIEWGEDALVDLLSAGGLDCVLTAIVGVAGLHSTLAAIEAGIQVALANKETLVAAGPLVMAAARAAGTPILPVDSEHSAIHQAAQCGQPREIARIILTASGGPFRDLSSEQLKDVTVEQALEHPTWAMGKKITIDSATMMNKALEVIEARWLFDLPADAIAVMVHPQSIIHSMVEFVDGSVVAQLSPPDMRLPIQYALTYPRRVAGPCARFDWRSAFSLQFYPPDPQRFPAVELGLAVARDGGSCGAVLNAANEAAVAAYLAKRLAFADIVPACSQILRQHHYVPNPTLEEILQLDRWARQEFDKWICV